MRQTKCPTCGGKMVNIKILQIQALECESCKQMMMHSRTKARIAQWIIKDPSSHFKGVAKNRNGKIYRP